MADKHYLFGEIIKIYITDQNRFSREQKYAYGIIQSVRTEEPAKKSELVPEILHYYTVVPFGETIPDENDIVRRVEYAFIDNYADIYKSLHIHERSIPFTVNEES